MNTIFKVYSYQDLPKGRQGIVDPEGNFISLGNVFEQAQHENKIKQFILEQQLKVVEDFEQKKGQLEQPSIYEYRPGIYNYKNLIIDFAGYCNYEIYPSTDVAVIDLPIRKINGKRATKEQELTLIKLVAINHNSLDSLYPVFSEKDVYLKDNSYQVVAGKIKTKKKDKV